MGRTTYGEHTAETLVRSVEKLQSLASRLQAVLDLMNTGKIERMTVPNQASLTGGIGDLETWLYGLESALRDAQVESGAFGQPRESGDVRDAKKSGVPRVPRKKKTPAK